MISVNDFACYIATNPVSLWGPEVNGLFGFTLIDTTAPMLCYVTLVRLNLFRASVSITEENWVSVTLVLSLGQKWSLGECSNKYMGIPSINLDTCVFPGPLAVVAVHGADHIILIIYYFQPYTLFSQKSQKEISLHRSHQKRALILSWFVIYAETELMHHMSSIGLPHS